MMTKKQIKSVAWATYIASIIFAVVLAISAMVTEVKR